MGPFGLSYLLEMLCLPPWGTEQRDRVEWAPEWAIGLSVTEEVGLIGLRSIAASLFISDTDFWMETGSTGSRSQHRYRLGSSPAVTSACLLFFDPTEALAGSCRKLIVWSFPLWLPSCAPALPLFARDSLLGVSGEVVRSGWLDAEYLRISMVLPHLIPGHDATVDLRCLAAPWAVIGRPLQGGRQPPLPLGLCVLEINPGSDCWSQRGGKGLGLLTLPSDVISSLRRMLCSLGRNKNGWQDGGRLVTHAGRRPDTDG